MTRSILRAAEWTLGVDADEEAAQGVSAVCLACGEQSVASAGDRLAVEIWALKHTGLHPGHRRYKATAETRWRVTPAESNPYREHDDRHDRADET
ncbi:hypothetical protein [Streptomyces xinghaiensis]|uniref:DUF7848 domain-containing protein n=1 Tax=Streptomyces xinghaiensis TaxID=1038928 RepID=UPI0002F370B2|nr:hypothetical protein [Streptomyces xinghaiensis]MZE77895.1 hypothetical protein [Streptomyces sp. SID5475]